MTPCAEDPLVPAIAVSITHTRQMKKASPIIRLIIIRDNSCLLHVIRHGWGMVTRKVGERRLASAEDGELSYRADFPLQRNNNGDANGQ